MMLEPLAGKGAERHDRESLGGGPVDRGLDQPSADAAAAHHAGDLGVHDHETVAPPPVDQLGEGFPPGRGSGVVPVRGVVPG
jgi:hypothetical protein